MRFRLFHVALCAALPALGSDHQLQTLETARALFHEATNAALYAESAERYEYLVEEEGVRNGHLFYTTGNAWFMAGDTGRAILNYRRAQAYLPRDADVEHNLQTALEARIDLISDKAPHPLASRFLGWHLNTSSAFRWWLFAGCWIAFWTAWFWNSRSAKKEALVGTIAAGTLSAILLVSLVAEAVFERTAASGVILAPEALARKGDGAMYAPAFMEPLHAGAEFQRLEERAAWWRVRLADGRTCWIPSNSAEMVALD